MNLAIIGAQGYDLGAYEAVKTLYSRVIPYFMVSAMGNNASMLGNIVFLHCLGRRLVRCM